MAKLIPAAEVLICWAWSTEAGGVTDVLCTPFPDDEHYFSQHWNCTSGACYSDWLKKHALTPEAIFGELAAFYGFSSPLVAEKAIVMFARIEECAWARAMMASDSLDRIK